MVTGAGELDDEDVVAPDELFVAVDATAPFADDPDGECAYVACSGSNDVAVVVPGCQQLVGTIPARGGE